MFSGYKLQTLAVQWLLITNMHVDIQRLHTTCRCSASGYYLQFFCFDVHWLLPADIVTNFICLDVQWSQSQSCLKDVVGQPLHGCMHDYLHKHANKPVACNYLNKAPYSIAIIVLDQSTVNMKGVLAILFAACILFKATEAAPSSNYHQIAVEDK